MAWPVVLTPRAARCTGGSGLRGTSPPSPVYADGKIFFNSQEGKTVIVEPAKTFTKLTENQLSNALMASPIAVGKALYLRTDQALYRIEKG